MICGTYWCSFATSTKCIKKQNIVAFATRYKRKIIMDYDL